MIAPLKPGEAPAVLAKLGKRTGVFSHNGGDLVAAWQTIREIGDVQALDAAVEDAFPGACIIIHINDERLGLMFKQYGLLRPLAVAELADGTLRYLLWVPTFCTESGQTQYYKAVLQEA